MSWWMGYGLTRAVGSLIQSESGSKARASDDDYILPDERARQAACALFAADADLAATKIDVRVLSGEMRLTGSVASDALRARAAQLCVALDGVSKLENELVVER